MQEICLVLVDALGTRNFTLWQEYLNENFARIDHAAATLITTRAAFRMLGLVRTSQEQQLAVLADIRGDRAHLG